MPSMKVKLRVPFSSANPPLTKPRSEDEMEVNASHQASDSGSAGQGEDEDELDGEFLPSAEVKGVLKTAAEMDELVDEMPPTAETGSAQASPRRNRITVKPRASAVSMSPSPSTERVEPGSVSPRIRAGSATSSLTGKKAAAARASEANSMTVEQLDALPAAKRRKSHKARGAPGPGRGWRKGLTKGQKPVYELPALAAQATTPSSFVSNAQASSAATSQRASPMAPIKAESSYRKIPPPAAARDFYTDLSAKAGTARNPGFRYPHLPSSRGGPPVLPIARIPVAFQTALTIDKTQKDKVPRKWIKAKREILSLGGRPWSIPTWYGGHDRDFEKKYDPAIAAVLGQAPPPMRPSGGHRPAATTPSKSASQEKGMASPLPPPKHVTLVKEAAAADGNWRGQSPAFLAGSR